MVFTGVVGRAITGKAGLPGAEEMLYGPIAKCYWRYDG